MPEEQQTIQFINSLVPSECRYWLPKTTVNTFSSPASRVKEDFNTNKCPHLPHSLETCRILAETKPPYEAKSYLPWLYPQCCVGWRVAGMRWTGCFSSIAATRNWCHVAHLAPLPSLSTHLLPFESMWLRSQHRDIPKTYVVWCWQWVATINFRPSRVFRR